MAQPREPSVTPLEGKTTLDEKVTFEPIRLSYVCAERLASKVAAAVHDQVAAKRVVIASARFLADLAGLAALKAAFTELERDYESLRESAEVFARRSTQGEREGDADFVAKAIPALAAAVPVVLGVVQTAVGLVSLFREDVDYKGAVTVVDPLAFELALAAALKHNEASAVLVPDLTVTLPLETEGSLLRCIERLQTAKQGAWTAMAPMLSKLTRLDVTLARAAAREDQQGVDRLSAEHAMLQRQLDPISEPLSRADHRLGELWSQLDRIDEGSGLTVLARLLRAEAIANGDPSYVHASVVASGGHHRIARSLWGSRFGGDGLTAMGGAVARWALLTSHGEVVDAGILVDKEVSTSI